MKLNATPLSKGEGLGLRFFLFLATLAPISAQTSIHISHGCAYKTAVEETTLYTFAGSEEVDRIVREICNAMVLKPNFDLKAASVDNALAATENGRRLILYSEVFLQKFNLDARTRWAAYSVMAHEIGHHLNNHDFSETNPAKCKTMELEADQFSGSALRLLGASLEEAKSGIETFALEGEQTKHPSAKARQAAITSGWTQQQERLEKMGVGTTTNPDTGAARERDTDGDGVPDRSDACPEEFGRVLTAGCPDGDEDGIPDRDDKCRYRKGPAAWQGCPDTDGDGIPDHEDQCPDKPGYLTDKGCPPPDRDRDGVNDRVDKCPDAKGLAQFQGCPDTDGDGIPDGDDKCPNEKGEPWLDGCKTAVSPEVPDNMVFIPGGTFKMGSDDGSTLGKPAHTVTVSDFYMSKFEVTTAEFKVFIDDSGYKTDADKGDGSYIWTGSDYKKEKGVNWRCDSQGIPRPVAEYNHPVIHVSWNDAVAYCQWKSIKTGKNYRLPTEAEWEYAAGGGDAGINTRTIWAGTSTEKTLSSYCNYDNSGKDKFNYTAPVGSFNPNNLGLFDMSGNVYEWCSDWYGEYKAGGQTNPTGVTLGTRRILRGGNWSHPLQNCRVEFRNLLEPDGRDSGLGFRLALQ